MPIPLPQDVLIENLAKGMSEFSKAVGVDKGIHHRVGMGENDCNVHHPDVWALTVLANMVDAIDNMHRKPAQSKQTNDNS